MLKWPSDVINMERLFEISEVPSFGPFLVLFTNNIYLVKETQEDSDSSLYVVGVASSNLINCYTNVFVTMYFIALI